jgi:hypothetical protein
MSDSNLNEDFLEVDQPIPGQNYCCMSFVSPEDVLDNKNVFFVHKFLETIAKNYDLDKTTIQSKYKDFLYINSDKLDKEFYEDNDFKTTMRGIKIRGTYDTLKEAEIRAKVLQKRDKNFNVFVGQVGYWLPWNPQHDKIENQEYAESELNNLVKEYKSNNEKKDQHFQENIDYVKQQAKIESENKKKANIEKKIEFSESSDDLNSQFEKEDPWISDKKTTSSESEEIVNNDA